MSKQYVRSWFWVLDSEFSLQILGPGFWDPGPKSWVLVNSLVITTCDEKLLQSMTRITRVAVTITKYERYYIDITL